MRWSHGQPPQLEPGDLDDLEDRDRTEPRDPAAGDPPEVDAWDSDETRAFADLIERRHVAPRVPWLEACEAWRSGTDLLESFGERLWQAAATGDRIGPRLTPTEVAVPDRLRKGLSACQKPFHLWNVERIVSDARFKLEPVAKLSLGQAALLSEEQRPPRKLEKATAALVELVDERDFRVLMERQQREQRIRAWIEPLPFGVPDEPPPGAGTRVISLEELMAMRDRGERPPGFEGGPSPPRRAPPARREPDARPVSGGFDLSQPDDDDDDDRGPPRSASGGFDLSQPDDDDDR